MTISHICTLTPLRVETTVCMWGEVPDVITPTKFDVGSGIFDPWESKNWGVPLTRQVALTAVLHYHAECDVHK